MGQQSPQSSPSKKKYQSVKNQIKSKQLLAFQRDPRLVQRFTNVPQLFAGLIDADIKRVQRLIESMLPHLLQEHIIDGLNERFFKTNSLKNEASLNIASLGIINNDKKKNTSSKNQNILIKQTTQQESQQTYYELQNLQRFLDFIKKLQHWYYVQKQLDNGLRLKKQTKRITIRKKITPTYQSMLNNHLFSKLFLHYYLVLLKRNFASKDKNTKNFMVDFHQSIGKMICQMIQHQHLNQKKLIQLTYKIVCVEKMRDRKKLIAVLAEIKQEFKPIYLTKQHSLVLKPSQYDRIRQTARCYLDQLYLRCLKEAEDPDIIVDQNQGFGIVKNFPIFRVRDQKNR